MYGKLCKQAAYAYSSDFNTVRNQDKMWGLKTIRRDQWLWNPEHTMGTACAKTPKGRCILLL